MGLLSQMVFAPVNPVHSTSSQLSPQLLANDHGADLG